jgi:Spy/CpxP family protein refolding chaperone
MINSIKQTGETTMRKFNKLAVASVAILVSSAAMAAPGMGPMHGDGAGPQHKMSRDHQGPRAKHAGKGMMDGMGMFRGIDLTPEQRQKIQVIYYEGKAKIAAMPRAANQEAGEWQNLLTADKFDEAQVRQQLEGRMKAQIDRRVQMAKVHYDLYQVLTPEQKAQVKKNHETRMAHFNQRMNGNGMGPHNPNCPMMP